MSNKIDEIIENLSIHQSHLCLENNYVPPKSCQLKSSLSNARVKKSRRKPSKIHKYCDMPSKFQETWREFVEALHSTDDFDPVHWLRRLLTAATHEIVYHINNTSISPVLKLFRGWRALVPAFAFLLILTVSASYFFFYDFIIQDRWCNNNSRPCASAGAGAGAVADVNELNGYRFCFWGLFHAMITLYLTLMVLWNYSMAVFSSPGVALPKSKLTHEKYSDSICISWKSVEGRGGFLFLNPIPVDIPTEKKRTNLYLPSSKDIHSYKDAMNANANANAYSAVDENKKKSDWFPSPLPTYCKKCEIVRPPRCHHCNKCNRCILQMDHHCPWMNNCIGYANYRTFILSLFYMVIGTWYALALAFIPFLQAFSDQYNKTFLGKMAIQYAYAIDVDVDVDVSSPCLHLRFQESRIFHLSTQNLITTLYPFLLAVSLVLSFFLYSHGKQIAAGKTTLEAIQSLERTKLEIKFLMNKSKNTSAAVQTSEPYNPFHQGFLNNLLQILGPNVKLAFLPIVAESYHPFLPSHKQIHAHFKQQHECTKVV